VFTIYDGTKFIGVIGLTRIPPVVANRIFRKAPAMRGLEIWLTLQAPSRQQDSGRQIVREIIRFAFERLKASNLLWRYNPTSQSTHWLAKGLNFQPLNSEFFSSRYVRYLYLANPNVTFSRF
jgi:RimJ/RimL family protein N-acetyltransferase